MTKDEKQLIVKAVEHGIPAIAPECLRALDEAEQVANAKQEKLNGAEGFEVLNQAIYNTIIKTIVASYPFMADEVAGTFARAVNECNQKFGLNIQARQAAQQKSNAEGAADGEKTLSEPV